jgi:two-component system, OmpR family, alkaline phosphatase synthesis response regulator PhoP
MARKLLIVDDEIYIRSLLEQTLEELQDSGIEILTADNGSDALDIIQREKPDLVFLDVMMPRMSGFDVCKAVKATADTAGVYVVMLTAKGQEFDKQKGSEVGANTYMTKPFDPDEVLTKAKEVLCL